MTQQPLISIRDLHVRYRTEGLLWGGRREVRAVDGVSLEIDRNETLGLVGESGCGKSTFGKAVLRLIEIEQGKIFLEGTDLTGLSRTAMRKHRKRLQMIFQDPYNSLNPRMTAGEIISEPIRAFSSDKKDRIDLKVAELLDTVGLGRRAANRFPRQFSGGQRQRIGIARALAAEPDLIVADEPVSALDVSIQAQILNLMERVQAERGLAYLFISHDLRAVRQISHRIAVMYLGRIVEIAPADELYAGPLMPYTKALVSAVPIPDPLVEAKRERIVLSGDLPSPSDPPTGCRFHTRCNYAVPQCRETEPALIEIRPRHFAACSRISPERPDIDMNTDRQSQQ